MQKGQDFRFPSLKHFSQLELTILFKWPQSHYHSVHSFLKPHFDQIGSFIDRFSIHIEHFHKVWLSENQFAQVAPLFEDCQIFQIQKIEDSHIFQTVSDLLYLVLQVEHIQLLSRQ